MRSIHLRSLLLASSILTLAGAAHAQTVAEVESVIVTGSRLQGGFQAPTPVTVLGTEMLEQRAATTISDAVNEMPAFRQSTTNSQAQRGNNGGGQNRVDLRGLGDTRTLVLLDGRRHVPTNLNGTVDINLIPTLLVERVEVVTGGASAAYGSDAVSGVVNFVLKDRMEGLQATVQYGVAQEGDNQEPAVSLAGGHSFAGGKGHIIAGGEWSDHKGMGTIYQRAWGRKQPGLLSFGTLAARGNLPAQGLAENVTYSAQADGGVITSGPLKGTAFGAGGTPFAFQYGTVYSNVMVGGQNGPDASPFGNWKVIAPHKRYNALVRGNYDFTDHITGFIEGGYSHQDSDALSTYHQSPGLIVPITNPFIPVATRAAMVAANLTSITVGRYDTELGGYQFNIGTTTERATAGLRGDFDAAGSNWQWDAYYDHGVTKGDQTLFTNIWEGNWLASTYVVTGANGSPVCGPTATNPNLTGANAAVGILRIPQIQPGCVPFNIFGRNSASQAAKDYIKGESQTKTRFQQDVVAVNLRGEPFSLWAGPVSMAAGLERREQSGASKANYFGSIQAGLSNNGSTYSGEVTVTEGYLEAGVPLAKDLSWAKTLDLNGSVRHTDYSTSGAVTTWKVGVTYEPTDWLRLRATRSRDIRAANISELFASGGRGITANALNPINNRTGALFTESGGNPNLTPEIANNVTAGVVFQPQWEWASGLRASVDYYTVDIEDVIASVSAAEILRRCALNIAEYCALIDFDSSTFGIAQVHTTPANLNNLRTKGMDFEIVYRVPVDYFNMPGRLDIRWLTTHVWELATTDAISTIERAGSGTGGVPTWVSNLTVNYALDRFSNSLQFRYNNEFKGDAALVGPEDDGYSPTLTNSTNKNRYPSVIYVNYSAQYDVVQSPSHSVQVFGVINNLMDRDPPSTAIIGLIGGGDPYDLIGRAFKIGARLKY